MTLELRFAIEIFAVALAAMFSLLLSYRYRKSIFIIVLVPTILFLSLDSYKSVESMLGTSRPDAVPAKRVLVLGAMAEGKKYLHFWYLDPDVREPRAIRLPYSENNNRVIAEFQARQRQGKDTFMEFQDNEKGDMKDGEGRVGGLLGPRQSPEIIIYDFSTEFHSLKNRWRTM